MSTALAGRRRIAKLACHGHWNGIAGFPGGPRACVSPGGPSVVKVKARGIAAAEPLKHSVLQCFVTFRCVWICVWTLVSWFQFGFQCPWCEFCCPSCSALLAYWCILCSCFPLLTQHRPNMGLTKSKRKRKGKGKRKRKGANMGPTHGDRTAAQNILGRS